MRLQPNSETRPFAVLSGVVGSGAMNLFALGMGATLNLWLLGAATAALLLAIGMEMWALRKSAGDEDAKA